MVVCVAGCSSPRTWRAICLAALTDCGVPGSTASIGARTCVAVAAVVVAVTPGGIARSWLAAVMCHLRGPDPAMLAWTADKLRSNTWRAASVALATVALARILLATVAFAKAAFAGIVLATAGRRSFEAPMSAEIRSE
jgi:hypothetical protein